MNFAATVRTTSDTTQLGIKPVSDIQERFEPIASVLERCDEKSLAYLLPKKAA